MPDRSGKMSRVCRKLGLPAATDGSRPGVDCRLVAGASLRPLRDRSGKSLREERRIPYRLPIGTVAVPAAETQPAADVSVTDSATLPLLPAVKVIRLVPWPALMLPFAMLQS